MTDTSLLARIPLFADLPADELSWLAGTLHQVTAAQGELLIREGETSDSLYIVIDGELDVLKAADTPDELAINHIGPGEYAGEMALMVPGGVRSASIRARMPTRLWLMHRDELDQLLRRQPLMAYTMVRVLSQRLDETNTSSFRDLVAKNQALQQAYDELKAAQEQLIEKERLERELQVAADIQMSILPKVLPGASNCDFGACVVPARRVGGDFYDVFPVDGNRMGVLIGDVADKGVPSAIFMARTHAFIMAEAARGGTPGDVLRQVNYFLTHLEQSEQFVTVIYGLYDLATGEFAYARAGHEPPLTVAGSSGEVIRLPHRAGQALGLLDEVVLDEYTVQLSPGMTLLLFTDGMTDCRSPQGEPFGLDRIRQALAGMAGLPAQEVCDRLLETLIAWQSGAPQDDDVTLVALRRAA
jgi:serine phosphatase RsbU (regulator of sigma subunit)